MAEVPTFRTIALDCPDALALAEFYAALLQWPAPKSSEDGEWVDLAGPDGVKISFQRVENYRPPQWPGQEVPQQLHLDLAVSDLDEGQEWALSVGAELLDDKPEHFRVFADPVGHPFCLCAC